MNFHIPGTLKFNLYRKKKSTFFFSLSLSSVPIEMNESLIEKLVQIEVTRKFEWEIHWILNPTLEMVMCYVERIC